MKFNLFSSLVLLFFATGVMGADHNSYYVEERHREIKSLSSSDIEELQRGGGWGLARAAELNGVPGPIHILEMKTEILLTVTQEAQIKDLYHSMNEKAVALGQEFIELERKLNDEFKNNTINSDSLESYVQEIESIRSQLRFVHLSAHLETPKILTREQIELYNQLRGYRNNPCDNIPQGHNPTMWKKHHGCS